LAELNSPDKTLVLGLGNPILGDDAAGLYVVKELKNRIDRADVTLAETHLGGIRLLDLLAGFDRVILIDAIQTKHGTPGQVYRLTDGNFDAARHIASPHEISFTQTLELGKKLGLKLPSDIRIIAIEAAEVSTFSEQLTPAVQKAIPTAVETVLIEINK